MLTVTVRNARLNLSKYLKLVEHGEEVVVKNRNTPVARIIPFTESRKTRKFLDLSELRALQNMQEATADKMVRNDRDSRV